MSGPAFEFREGMTYEEAVAGLTEAIRSGREGITEAAQTGHRPEPPSPGEIASRDQFHAAAEDSMESLYAMGSLLGYPVTDDVMTDDVLARVTLAWLACHSCPHIKQNSAQPHVALLAVHRLVCERCAKTLVNPPPENDDRCDWCWAHGHTDFWPIRMSYGPAILMGDACDNCNAKLKAGVPDGPSEDQ